MYELRKPIGSRLLNIASRALWLTNGTLLLKSFSLRSLYSRELMTSTTIQLDPKMLAALVKKLRFKVLI